MNRALLVCTFASLSLVTSCKKNSDQMNATKSEWLAAAPACPAPATCTGKITAMTREVSICSPHDPGATYAAGDVLVVHEPTTVNTLAKVKAPKGDGYDVEFPDGYVLERKKTAVLGRVCK